jgi:hypothetical protein
MKLNIKTILLAVAMIALCGSVSAQDKIYKSDGDILDAKIKSVGVKTITYLMFNNQTGPEYTIEKAAVEKIVYQNGSEDVFDEWRPVRHMRYRRGMGSDITAPHTKLHYKPSVLAIAPLQFSENGLGVGLSYERALDKDGFIAFYMPVILTWDLNNGTYVNSNGNTVNGNADMMFYAMPGIKLYPTGSFGPIKYSVGPSLVIASGQKSSAAYDPTGTYISSYNTQSHFVLGMIVNNSLNINPGPHIYLGLEVGLGFSYLNTVGGLNQGTEFLVQGGFKIGYRF